MRGPAIVITGRELRASEYGKQYRGGYRWLEKLSYLSKHHPYSRVQLFDADVSLYVQPDMRLKDFQIAKKAGVATWHE